MAKAVTILLLLAATAVLTSAHPGLGKGAVQSISVTKEGEGGGDKSFKKDCGCTEDCRKNERTVCKEVEKEEEVCKDEDVVEEITVCEDKCIKTDKVITIGHMGKGRRMMNANAANVMPHLLGALHGGKGADKDKDKDKQTICREVCRPETKKSKEKKCKKEKKKEFVDCKVEVLGPPVCKKVCECDHPLNKVFGHMGKGKGH